MGFWRSLRQWWCWDGTPETDPFRDRDADAGSAEPGVESSDVSGHARSTAGDRPDERDDEEDD